MVQQCQLCSPAGKEVAKRNMISLFPSNDGDATTSGILPSSVRVLVIPDS